MLRRQLLYKCALAVVIWVVVYNIIAVSEWWEAYLASFKDFFVMITTFTMVFIFDTGVDLAVGLGVSLVVYLFEYVFFLGEINLSRKR